MLVPEAYRRASMKSRALIAVAIPGQPREVARMKRSAIRIITVAAVTATALPGLITPTTAAAAPAADDTIVLTGQMMKSGTPSAGKVSVIAWPNNDILAKLKKGQSATARVVQQMDSAADGGFAVHLDPATLPAGYLSARGQVDLELVMTDGTHQATWSTSAVKEDVSTGLASRAATHGWTLHGTPPGQSSVKFDLAAGTINAGNTPVDKPDAADKTIKHLAAGSVVSKSGPLLATAAVVPMETCVISPGDTYTNKTEKFAHVYAWSGAKGIVDFNTGSEHTLGIAVTSGGAWSQSGTATISTNSGATVNGVVDATAINKVNYRDYYNSCTPYTYRKPLSFYSLLPSSSFTYATHANYSTCSTYNAGANIWKQDGTNLTFSTGVPLGVANVSAKSGWNTATKVSWDITAKTKVCGSTTAGWVTSPDMDARKG